MTWVGSRKGKKDQLVLADHLEVCWSPITAQDGMNVSTSVTYILCAKHSCLCEYFLRFAYSGLFYLLARTLLLGTISFLASIKFKVSVQYLVAVWHFCGYLVSEFVGFFCTLAMKCLSMVMLLAFILQLSMNLTLLKIKNSKSWLWYEVLFLMNIWHPVS